MFTVLQLGEHCRKKFATFRDYARNPLVMNAVALTALQAGGNLALIITLPYLARVLGPEEWGRVAWAQVLLGYLVIFTDGGFSWYGTARAAVLRDSIRNRSAQFLAGWSVQGLLTLFAVIGLGIFHLYADIYMQFREYTGYIALYLFGMLSFPAWYPGGLERLREVALFQFSVRVGSMPLVFIFVQDKGDGPLALGAMAASSLLSGAAGVVWMVRNIEVDWKWPSLGAVRSEARAGAAVLMSRVWITLFTTLIPSILGFVLGPIAVGIYMLADRVRAGVVAIMSPMMQSLVPRISYYLSTDARKAKNLFFKSCLIIVAIAGSFSMIMLMFSSEIVSALGGGQFESSGKVLKIFSIMPILAMLSAIIGLQIMIPQGYPKPYNTILVISGAVSLGTILPLILHFGVAGAAMAAVIGEIISAGLLTTYVWRRRSIIFGG